jgi:hypothetical protein
LLLGATGSGRNARALHACRHGATTCKVAMRCNTAEPRGKRRVGGTGLVHGRQRSVRLLGRLVLRQLRVLPPGRRT